MTAAVEVTLNLAGLHDFKGPDGAGEVLFDLDMHEWNQQLFFLWRMVE